VRATGASMQIRDGKDDRMISGFWSRTAVLTTLATAVCVLTMGRVALAQDIPAEAIEKMREAMPTRAAATPKQPRRILVFSLCKGFKHSAIPYGEAAIEMLGETTGAWEAVISDDVAMFEAENLESFDLVLFNNTTANCSKSRGCAGT
jgi:hypothetical protein